MVRCCKPNLVVVAGAVIYCALLAVVEVTAGVPSFRLLDLGGRYVKWSGTKLGQGATVTYAYASADARISGARNCEHVVPLDPLLRNSGIATAVLQREVEAAFAMWSAVADISFKEVPFTDGAGIIIGAQGVPRGRAFADVTNLRNAGSIQQIANARICLNPLVGWKVGFDGNFDSYDLRFTLAHEIGHAIGLDHPKASGVLMAFRYDERVRELQPGDVDGAIALYGPRAPVEARAD